MMWNGAPCPFCKVDAADPDAGPPCVHLIADFGDGTDGDRGILSGASRCDNSALSCLDDLEASLGAFTAAVSMGCNLEDGLSESDKAELVEALGFADQVPTWLGTALEEMEYGEQPGYRTVEAAWSEAVPWSERLRATTSLIGGMASTMVTFVWAADPTEGASQIAGAISEVERQVGAATKSLAEGKWAARAGNGS